MPMLIFRAWATCGWTYWKCASVIGAGGSQGETKQGKLVPSNTALAFIKSQNVIEMAWYERDRLC